MQSIEIHYEFEAGNAESLFCPRCGNLIVVTAQGTELKGTFSDGVKFPCRKCGTFFFIQGNVQKKK